MDKIKWCCNQKRGIELIEKKEHLSEKYMEEAEESLDICSKITGKWQIISGYYSCYNAFYSILMKCGIKSEIHECTIALMDLFEMNKEKEFLEELKEKRIQAQYYLKEIKLKGIKEVKEFLEKCKEIVEDLNSEKIEEIRNKIKGMKNEN